MNLSALPGFCRPVSGFCFSAWLCGYFHLQGVYDQWQEAKIHPLGNVTRQQDMKPCSREPVFCSREPKFPAGSLY